MTTVNKKLAAERIGTSPQTLYTVPAPTPPDTISRTLVTFFNVSFKNATDVSLWLVPAGENPNNDNIVWDEVQSTSDFSTARAVYWVLEEGGKIVAEADNSDTVTLRFDGIEIQE